MIKYRVVGSDNQTYSYTYNLSYAKRRCRKLNNEPGISFQVQEYKDGRFVKVVYQVDDD